MPAAVTERSRKACGIATLRAQPLVEKCGLGLPFFFDPNFNVEVKPIELKDVLVNDDKSDRCDKASIHEFDGTYGEYLLNKVSKVFPEPRQKVLESAE